MDSARDLELLVRSRIPLIVIETYEEQRVLELARRLSRGLDIDRRFSPPASRG